MPIWIVDYSHDALKTLERLPRNLRVRIRNKVEALARDPLAPNNNVKALEGGEGYRLRIGDWRVVHTLESSVLTVVVVRIAPRGSAYR